MVKIVSIPEGISEEFHEGLLGEVFPINSVDERYTNPYEIIALGHVFNFNNNNIEKYRGSYTLEDDMGFDDFGDDTPYGIEDELLRGMNDLVYSIKMHLNKNRITSGNILHALTSLQSAKTYMEYEARENSRR